MTEQTLARISEGKSVGGRPLKFQSVEALDKAIDDYFDNTEYPTITGLAVHLNTSRRTLIDTASRPEFTHSIKRAVDMCEAFVEQAAMMGKANATMAIFTLKNNYGWKDVQQVEQSMEITAKPQQEIAQDFSTYVKSKTEALPSTTDTKAQDLQS